MKQEPNNQCRPRLIAALIFFPLVGVAEASGVAYLGGLFCQVGVNMTNLLLKSSGPVADQYKVLAGDEVVGHIRLSKSAPEATPWRWTLAAWAKGRRAPTLGYGGTREEALQALARSWHRE